MSLVQELTPMKPEIRDALLSAEGEKWHGEWGAPHARDPKTICGSKEGRFTKVQRKIMRYLKEHKQAVSKELNSLIGARSASIMACLLSSGWVKRIDRPGEIIYKITDDGLSVEMQKPQKEIAVDLMKSLDVFTIADLTIDVSRTVAQRAVKSMVHCGAVEVVKSGYKAVYRWVK